MRFDVGTSRSIQMLLVITAAVTAIILAAGMAYFHSAAVGLVPIIVIALAYAAVRLPGTIFAAFLYNPVFKGALQPVVPVDITPVLAMLCLALSVPLVPKTDYRIPQTAIALWLSLLGLIMLGAIYDPDSEHAIAQSLNFLFLVFLPCLLGFRIAREEHLQKQFLWATLIFFLVVTVVGVAQLGAVGVNERLTVLGTNTVGLANETALMCDRLGIDVWEVIGAASTKPFGFMPFYPGPGIGEHCIPLDPHYLSWKMKTLNYKARFIELASEINASMPHHVVSKVTDALNDAKKSVKGSDILVLGVAYKAHIDDARESPALDIIGLLQARGAHVQYHDPHIDQISLPSGTIHSDALTSASVRDADCVVVVTKHRAIGYYMVESNAKLVVDSRNALAPVKHPRPGHVKTI